MDQDAHGHFEANMEAVRGTSSTHLHSPEDEVKSQKNIIGSMTHEDSKTLNLARFELGKFWFSATARGLDNVHIYLWILKDLSWTLDNFWMSAICGSLAIAWCVVLILVAYRGRDWEEMYMLIATILWLFGNFWWMTAETGIDGDDDVHSKQSSFMLMAGLLWLAVFYFVLRPCGIILESPAVTELYLALDLKPRLPLYFKNWRQYEYLHMLFWVGKDLSWNLMFLPTWVLALSLTLTLGIDFIWISYDKGYVIDTAHYAAQLLWVMANAAWAAGEFFTDSDEAYALSDHSHRALQTGRWWADVLLVTAFAPIFLLYFVWLPYQYYLALSHEERADDHTSVNFVVPCLLEGVESDATDNPLATSVPSSSDKFPSGQSAPWSEDEPSANRIQNNLYI